MSLKHPEQEGTEQNYMILVEETKPAGLCTQNRSTPRAGAYPHSQQDHADSFSHTFKEGRCTRMTRMRMRRRYRLTNRMIWKKRSAGWPGCWWGEGKVRKDQQDGQDKDENKGWKDLQNDQDEVEEKVQNDHQDDQEEVTSRMARMKMKIRYGRTSKISRIG